MVQYGAGALELEPHQPHLPAGRLELLLQASHPPGDESGINRRGLVGRLDPLGPAGQRTDDDGHQRQQPATHQQPLQERPARLGVSVGRSLHGRTSYES
jgi:hypothetical protein